MSISSIRLRNTNGKQPYQQGLNGGPLPPELRLTKQLSVIEETLEKELASTKAKLRAVEQKNDSLLSQVFDLRRLLKRIGYEEDLNMIRFEKLVQKKDDEIDNLRSLLKTLEKNSKLLDQVGSYWVEVVNEETCIDFEQEEFKEEDDAK